MTQDEIIDMAKQAASTKSFHEFFPRLNIDVLEAFAKLVAAKEREACAELCMDLHTLTDGAHNYYHFAANQIRTRGEA